MSMSKQEQAPPSKHLTRRGFLRAACISAAGCALPGAARASASASSSSSGQKEELATVLDISNCIGCGARGKTGLHLA